MINYSKIILFILLLTGILLNGAEPLQNADFSQWKNGKPKNWAIRSGSPEQIKASNRELTLDGASKEVLIAQFNLPLKKGMTYLLSYQAKATQQGSHRIYCQWQIIASGKPGWQGIGGKWLDTPSDWKDYNLEIKVPKEAKVPYLAIGAAKNSKISIRNLHLDPKVIHLTPTNDLAVFSPNEEVCFRVKNPAKTTAKYQVTDFDRKTVKAGTISAKASSELNLGMHPSGYYQLNLDSPMAENYSFAVIQEPGAYTTAETNQFGAMVVPHTAYPEWKKELDARYMQRIGIRWVRTHRLNWSRVQNGPGKPFNWAAADAEVAMYHNHGLKIVATTCWPIPQWASSGNADPAISGGRKILMSPAPEYIPDLKKFCQELASRYRGKIGYYEIGNEVDAMNFWLGSPEHAAEGNAMGIVQDFCEYFGICAQSIHAGDPNAKVAPNTTGAVPAGHTYKPWLKSFYKFGGGKYMDVFSTHYMADMDAIREIMQKNGKEVDIIFTEIGGMLKTEKKTATEDELEKIIKISYIQFTSQLFKGGKALCKFLLRDICNVNEGWIAGMLDENFKIRPEYVAYATLIRMLADTVPAQELNLVRSTNTGWGQGFSFKSSNGQIVNVIFLNDAKKGRISLKTNESSLLITDVMGVSRSLKPVNGLIALDMVQFRPVFITGELTNLPGKIEYPKPQLVKSIKIPVKNGNFEYKSDTGNIPDWHILWNETVSSKGKPVDSFKVFIDSKQSNKGKSSLCMKATEKTQWWGIQYLLPMNMIPKPGPGEYIEIIVSYDLKADAIKGIGSGVTIATRDNNMRRVAFNTGNWTCGTFNWKKNTYRVKFERFHPDMKQLALEFFLGQATGSSWHDNIEVTVNLWRTSGNIAKDIN